MKKKLACLALIGIFAAPVFADPPSHAPAHGYRNKHQKYDNYDRYDQRPVYQEQRQVYQKPKPRCNNMAGAAIGGGLGGAVGSQVGTGTTNTIAIGAAAATGAIIGSQLDGCN